MSSIPMDFNQLKTAHLLRRLSLGSLDKDGAKDLRALLRLQLEEARRKNDSDHVNDLSSLIRILDMYISGQIDLNPRPKVDLNISNLT